MSPLQELDSHTSPYNIAGITFTINPNQNVTAGSLLHIMVFGASPTVSDNINGAWTQETDSSVTNSGLYTSFIFANSQAGAITITVTNGSSSIIAFIFTEWGQIVTVNPLDQSGHNTTSSGANPTVSTSGSLQNTGELVIGTIGTSANSLNNPNAYGIYQQSANAASNNIYVFYYVASNADVETMSWTTLSNSAFYLEINSYVTTQGVAGGTGGGLGLL